MNQLAMIGIVLVCTVTRLREYRHTMCAELQSILMSQQVVDIVTAVFLKVTTQTGTQRHEHAAWLFRKSTFSFLGQNMG